MKTKCLIIIPGIPYPPIDGHKLKIYNVIKILAEEFDLHIITIDRKPLESIEEKFIKGISYKSRHFRLSFFKVILRLFANIFTNIPFQASYFALPEVKKYLLYEALEEKYVVLNLIRTVEYQKMLKSKRIIFDMVDLLSRSYSKSAMTTSSFIYKLIYKIESKRLKNYEKDVIASSDLTLCVNKEESEAMNKYGNVAWIPNGVNNMLFDYNKTDPRYINSIVFFGAMFYQPNIDAVRWLDKHVLDKLDNNICIYIIGPRPSSEIVEIGKRRENVFVTGFLADPYLIINSSKAVVAPMQNGGGIQNKILETMALGKINILSNYAAAPIIGGIIGKHFVVEDEPLQMAGLINDVCQNPDKYAHIANNAREFIQNRYTWLNYRSLLMNEIEKISK